MRDFIAFQVNTISHYRRNTSTKIVLKPGGISVAKYWQYILGTNAKFADVDI